MSHEYAFIYKCIIIAVMHVGKFAGVQRLRENGRVSYYHITKVNFQCGTVLYLIETILPLQSEENVVM